MFTTGLVLPPSGTGCCACAGAAPAARARPAAAPIARVEMVRFTSVSPPLGVGDGPGPCDGLQPQQQRGSGPVAPLRVRAPSQRRLAGNARDTGARPIGRPPYTTRPLAF